MKMTKLCKLYLAVYALGCSMTAQSAFDDTGTDFSSEEQNIHVWSQALEPIETVNSILRFTKQMRAPDFINQGPYLVFADESQCFDDENNNGNQSSSAENTPSYMEVIVKATQTDAD